MRLLSQAPIRYVLLVVDDRAGSISTRLGRASSVAEVVAFTSSEAAVSALRSGRRYSALVADRVDPDLAEQAARAGTPAIAVGPAMTPEQLAAAVGGVATPVPRADWLPQLGPDVGRESPTGSADSGARLVAVCGPGGTGASSIAAALAGAASAFGQEAVSGQAEAGATHVTEAGQSRRILLADFALRADQSFLHGADEAPTGLLDLVDAGRYRAVSVADVRRHTVDLGGGRLLPGLRRATHWTAVSPPSFDEMLSALLGMFDLVVADITGDFEGEVETGSLDVEERNHMARATARRADVVVVISGPGAHGARRLAQVVDDLLDLGVDPSRVQPVINQVPVADPNDPTGSAHRAATRQPESHICGLPAPPIGVPLLARTEGSLLPPDAAGPVAAAVAGLLARTAAPIPSPAFVRVIPGSLGCAAL